MKKYIPSIVFFIAICSIILSPQFLFSFTIEESGELYLGHDNLGESMIPSTMVDTADVEVKFSMNPVTVDATSGPYGLIGYGSYTIEVTNRGPHAATNLELSTSYYDEVIPINSTVTSGTLSSPGARWKIPYLEVGETVYLYETSEINQTYDDKSVFVDLRKCDQFDPDSSPNSGFYYNEDDSDRLYLEFPRADLELSLSVDDPNYEKYESVKYELTVSNDGPSSAPGITISFPFPPGMVYTSDNTSKGTYSIYNKIWTVGTLVAGESATLNLDLFTLDEFGDKLAFAQIMTHEGLDLDSYPGNDTDQIADEDDEASVIVSAPTGQLPDLLVSLASQPDSAPSGSTFTTFFNLKNEGTAFADASIVSAYLSTDLVVSDDDLLVGSQSMFTEIDAGETHTQVPIECSIPVGTVSGFYNLILFADADEEISELEEFNNFSTISFYIFGGSSSTCPSSSAFPWHEWISRVQINDIDNPSGKSTRSDFSDISTDLQMGQSYDVELETSFSYTGYDEYWRVWIDFNGNGSLNDAGDMVVDEVLLAPADGTPKASIMANFTIPNGWNPGNRKMRVSMKRGSVPLPCTHNSFGEVEDYTVNIIADAISNINIDCTADLSVALPMGESSIPVVWDVPTVNSTCLGGAFELNQIGGESSGSDFSEGVYFIEYEATDDCGNSAFCAFVLTVSETSTYCDPESDFPWHEWISGMSIGNYSKQSGKSTYSDFTNEVIEIEAGGQYDLELTTGFSYATYDEYWSLWIDYDKNGIFDPISELLYSGILSAPANGTDNEALFASIDVPEDAPLGMTGMRVMMKREAIADPCETIPFGEVEDYLVNINPSNSLLPFKQNEYLSEEEMKVILFPNPASYEINLIVRDLLHEEVAVNIHNAFGRLKSSTQYNLTADEKITIPLANFENGIYFITVNRSKTKPITKRIIVENGK